MILTPPCIVFNLGHKILVLLILNSACVLPASVPILSKLENSMSSLRDDVVTEHEPRILFNKGKSILFAFIFFPNVKAPQISCNLGNSISAPVSTEPVFKAMVISPATLTNGIMNLLT